LEAHRFALRGRHDAKLAGGAELDILQAVFGRIARWIADTGSVPRVVTTSHTQLLQLLPELVGPETAASITTTRRISDLAQRWRSALEDGVRFLAAAEGEEPNYSVRLYVRNANALLRFWFDIEFIDENGARHCRVTTARERRISLSEVVAETAIDAPYEYWARRIKTAATRGSETAKRALAVLARTAAWCLVVATVSWVIYLLLPQPAQAAIRKAGRRGLTTIRRLLAPSATTIEVIGERFPTPDAERRDTPDPTIVEEKHLGKYVVAHFPIAPALKVSDVGPDLEVLSIIKEYPEWVSIYASPSPQFRTGKKTIELTFSDNSPTETRALDSPDVWFAVMNHEFSYVPQEDLGRGDLSSPVMITMRVYDGHGRDKRLLEIVHREAYILVRPDALKSNPYAEEARRGRSPATP
jgi:hypothetical protein